MGNFFDRSRVHHPDSEMNQFSSNAVPLLQLICIIYCTPEAIGEPDSMLYFVISMSPVLISSSHLNLLLLAAEDEGIL